MIEERDKTPKRRLPRFRSREEEADFWDTHDSTEFNWRPVRMKIAKDLQHVLSIRIEMDVLTRLIETSRIRGVGLNEFTVGLISEGLDRIGAEPAPVRSRQSKHNE